MEGGINKVHHEGCIFIGAAFICFHDLPLRSSCHGLVFQTKSQARLLGSMWSRTMQMLKLAPTSLLPTVVKALQEVVQVKMWMSMSKPRDTIVVGAYNEEGSTTAIINGDDLSTADDAGTDNGAAYVFKRTGSTWTHEAYLKAPNNSNSDEFGYSVAISGDTIVVGARNEDSSTTAIINGADLSTADDLEADNGAVYVFKRSGSTWAHEAYLKAPNNSSRIASGIL